MNEFLKGILDGIYTLVGNYGWSMVLFTLLIKLVLMPFNYKSRVSMRKTTKLQPQLAEIQRKYAKDQDRMNQKMSELYRKEKVNPLSSCLPMLLTMPILFAMFAAMRMVANEQLAQQAMTILQGQEPLMEGWLWIRNLWMPDSPFSPAWPDLSMLQQIPADIWQKVITGMDAGVWENLSATITAATGVTIDPALFSDNLQNYITAIYNTMAQMPGYAEQVSKIPFTDLLIIKLDLFQSFNGFFILPLVAGVSQFVMTKLQPAAPAADPKDPKAQSQQSTGKFMQWFFPIFSLWICISSNAAFALYWVISNLISMGETVLFNLVLDAKEKKEAIAAKGEVK